VKAGLVENVALGKTAIQLSTYISPASSAIDGDNTTASCTNDDSGRPWWAVDLGQEYNISSVIIIMPDVSGDKRNYRRFCFIH